MSEMENGEGIDYSDNQPYPDLIPLFEGGDMYGTRYPNVTWDKYHPNDKVIFKMPLK